MSMPRRALLALLVVILAAISIALAAKNKKEDAKLPGAMDEQQRAVHALNRLTFGARPGDVQRVLAVGVDKWIEQQLRPDKIDDSALEARLAPLRTLKMDTRALVENFPPPQIIKAVAEGKLPMPSDPAKHAIYEAQVERYRMRQQNKQQQSDAAPANSPMSEEQQQARREQRRMAEARAESLMQMSPESRYQELLRMQEQDQRALITLPPVERARLLSDFTPQQRETIVALINPALVVTSELQEGKLLHTIYGERQLQEVMTDFWFNHFNVFVGKGPDRYLITSYERDVIRQHALGKFQDLLVATAKSPAMLVYLDNWQSVGPNSTFALGTPPQARRRAGPRPRARMGVGCGPFGCYPRVGVGTGVPIGRPAPPPRRPRNPPSQAVRKHVGLNENYARELMELQTLGVDGGYTQKDVTEVARVFTGWTLDKPFQGGQFTFNERRHEPGPKYVLGTEIKPGGEKEGMKVLSLLAHHPSTARFISTKLAQRFVSDTPPPALIDRMAKTFLQSDGDIRQVLRTMFHSPEFWSRQAYRAKVKTPLEFVASAVRASDADVRNPMPLVQVLNRMDMPLYGSQPPTGYSMQAEAWMNSAALLDRMNFALALAAGRLPGVTVDQQQLLTSYAVDKHHRIEATAVASTDAEALVPQLENALLSGQVSKQTHETILQQVSDQNRRNATHPAMTGLITGLILGSPEFQRR